MDTRKYGSGFVKPEDVRDGPRQEKIINVYISEKYDCLVLDLESGDQLSLNNTTTRVMNRAGCADFPLPVLHGRASLVVVYRWTIRGAGRGQRLRSALHDRERQLAGPGDRTLARALYRFPRWERKRDDRCSAHFGTATISRQRRNKSTSSACVAVATRRSR